MNGYGAPLLGGGIGLRERSKDDLEDLGVNPTIRRVPTEVSFSPTFHESGGGIQVAVRF